MRNLSFILAALLVTAGCYHDVQDHEIAVVTGTGGPQTETLQAGYHYEGIFESWHRYDMSDQLFTAQQNGDRGCQIEQSKDGQDLTICYKLRYKLDPTKLIYTDANGNIVGIHKEVRDQYESKLVQPEVERAIKDTAVTFTAKEIYTTGKTKFNNDVEDALRNNPDLGGKGIFVLTFVVTDLTLSPEYKGVIERTMLQRELDALARQEVSTAKTQAEAAAAKAQTAVEEARAVADAAKITQVLAAEATAEAQVAAARAQRVSSEEAAVGQLALGEAQAKVEKAKRDANYAGPAGERRMRVEIAKHNATAAAGIFNGVTHVGPETVRSVFGKFLGGNTR